MVSKYAIHGPISIDHIYAEAHIIQPGSEEFVLFLKNTFSFCFNH